MKGMTLSQALYATGFRFPSGSEIINHNGRLAVMSPFRGSEEEFQFQEFLMLDGKTQLSGVRAGHLFREDFIPLGNLPAVECLKWLGGDVNEIVTTWNRDAGVKA